MGILTLLRNAFGRGRKARAAEAEGADRRPSQEPEPTTTDPAAAPTAQVPEPRASSPDEHDLVSAAFDNITVPRQPDRSTEPPATDTPTPELVLNLTPDPEPEATPEPETKAEPEAKAKAEPAPEAKAKPTPEPEAEPAPEANAKPAPEPEAEPAPEAKPTPAAEAKAEPTPDPTPEAESAPELETKAEATPDPTPEAESAPELETKAEATQEAEAEPVDAKAKPKAETTPGTEPETKPEAAPEAEPEAEPETKAEPAAETKVEAEPEPESTPKPAEAEPKAQDKPEPKAEPKAQDKPEPEPKAEPAPKPAAAKAEAEAEPKPSTPEPQAADGEDTPQGPPAPDNETRTGGTGGNDPAEGEAEATPEPHAPPAEATPEPHASSAKPATPLTKIKSNTPSLATAYKAATTTLKKTNLTGTRAKLYLVLDRSASMRPYYKDGSAQALADQTLALAAHLDPEATVHVVFFSTEIDGTTDLTLTEDHETKIDDVHADLGRMGRTSYHAAVEAVLAHHEKNDEPGTPVLVVFQTDGAPDAKTPATQSLTEAAKNHPGVFFSFVAFGEHDNKAFDYLRKLKTGNTSFFHAGPTPRELTDTELYEGVLAAWRP
ncbi:VWA domain-containing protein [Streptomyces sp. NPDC090057]|uniref:VWA domain-containing protein n=1 Tax=Streptomyces sp. NPDC090057 TaxID=3365935 RepID=UPI00382C285A